MGIIDGALFILKLIVVFFALGMVAYAVVTYIV